MRETGRQRAWGLAAVTERAKKHPQGGSERNRRRRRRRPRQSAYGRELARASTRCSGFGCVCRVCPSCPARPTQYHKTNERTQYAFCTGDGLSLCVHRPLCPNTTPSSCTRALTVTTTMRTLHAVPAHPQQKLVPS